MTLVTTGPEFGNPAYEKTPEKPTMYDNTIEWLYGEQFHNGDYPRAVIDFSYYYDFGTMTVTTIISNAELTREELEEAIKNFFPRAQFEREMTINYNRP